MVGDSFSSSSKVLRILYYIDSDSRAKTTAKVAGNPLIIIDLGHRNLTVISAPC